MSAGQERQSENRSQSLADYLRSLCLEKGYRIIETPDKKIVICSGIYGATGGKWWQRQINNYDLFIMFGNLSSDPGKMMFTFTPTHLDLNCELALVIGRTNVSIATRQKALLETDFGSVSVTSFDPDPDPQAQAQRESRFYLTPPSDQMLLKKIAKTVKRYLK